MTFWGKMLDIHKYPWQEETSTAPQLAVRVKCETPCIALGGRHEKKETMPLKATAWSQKKNI